MEIKNNELAAVVYADLFGYPLTVSEAKLWAIRKTRQESSDRKLELAKRVCEQLKEISFIQGIFLTGSVATNNAKADADIDLMIVTVPGAMWLTRLMVIWLLKKNHLYKSVICPNIFLDSKHLEVRDKNLYTAHEVLQAKCLFDRGGVSYLWLVKNKWAREYLPNAYKHKINQANQPMSNKSMLTNQSISKLGIGNWVLKNWLLGFGLIELCAFVAQYLYQLPKQTNERVGWGFAFFHPRNLSEKVVQEFSRRVKIHQGYR